MGDRRPKVSIIIPTYNRGHILEETLNSVISQNYENWECIVVDDGSEDNSMQLLSSYAKRDSRIKYFARPSDRSKGGNVCRNFGLELSEGEYIQFLDSDDYLSEDKIKLQVVLLERNSAKMAICQWAYFKYNKKDARVQKDLAYYKNFSKGKELLDTFGKNKLFIPPHAYLIHKSLILQVGNWNEDLTINQDAEFFTRVLLKTSEIIFEPNSVVYYRMKLGDNVSAYKSEKRAQEVIDSWKLIELYIKLKYNETPCIYVEGAKERYFGRIKRQFPELIEDNKDFFRIQIRRSNMYNRILNKVNRIYLNIFSSK